MSRLAGLRNSGRGTAAIAGLFVLVLVLPAVFLALGTRQAHAAEGPPVVVVHSLSPEGTEVKEVTVTLEQLAQTDTFATQPANEVTIKVHNTTTATVTIRFCALLDGQSCKEGTARVFVAEAPVSATQTDGDETETVAKGCDSRTKFKRTMRVDGGYLRSLSLCIQMEDTEFEEAKTGLLVLQGATSADDNLDDTDYQDYTTLPLTLTPPKPPFFKQATFWAVIYGLPIAGLATLLVAIVIWWKDGLAPGGLWSLRMGRAKWDLSDSWASTIVVGVAILAGLTDFIPETATTITPTGFKALAALFAVLTAFAPFVYNAAVRPGPEKEEGKETPEKQGYTGLFLIASTVAIWSFMGQLGLQFLAVQEIRLAETAIPKFFLTAFQGFVVLLVGFVAWNTCVSLLRVIREQKVKIHKVSYKKRGPYTWAVRQIRDRTRNLQRDVAGLAGKLKDQAEVQKVVEQFTTVIGCTSSGPSRDETLCTRLKLTDPGEDADFSHLKSVFEKNLPVLLQIIGGQPDPAVARDALENLLEYMLADALEALQHLKQTLPIENVVPAFYSSLAAPPAVRKEAYKDALETITRHLQVACAQVQSTVEPDTILGANEALLTNIEASLTVLDEALGHAGKRDPFYANVHKLFLEIAKKRWEVLPDTGLRTELCALPDVLQSQVRPKLLLLELDKKPEKDSNGDWPIAAALIPLVESLGENKPPYNETFPVNYEAIDKLAELEAGLWPMLGKEFDEIREKLLEDQRDELENELSNPYGKEDPNYLKLKRQRTQNVGLSKIAGTVVNIR